MIEINGIYCLEGDTHITNDIRRTGTLKWDPTFEKVLQLIGAGNGRVMVDVGAYIGDSTKWFEDAGFLCFAYEPMPDAFECLQKNASPHTTCYNMAVGNRQPYSTTTEVNGNLGGRSLILEGNEIAPTLDSLVMCNIDVLKIDAEGFEPFILEGAKEILKKKPVVIIEINEEALSRFGFGPDDIFKHLADYDFEEVYRYGEGQYDLVCFPKMTFAIAMPVCNRPEYTRKALEAIHNMEQFDCFRVRISIDQQSDGTINESVLSVIRESPVVFQPAAQKLGCNRNVKAALDFAWESNPDVVICIEDDVVVTPDAFQYIKWAARRYKHDPSYRTIGLWSHKDGWKPSMPWNKSEPTRVMEQSLFSVWGWATWKDRWQEMSDNWTTGPDEHETSWDVVMLSQLKGRKEVVPSISRATNIGDIGGTHRGGIHPVVLASGFDTSGPYWAEIPQAKKKKVLVCLGRNGDNYMVAKAATEPCIIFTSQEFSPIIRELFPQHEIFILNKKVSGLMEAMQYAESRYPDHDVRPCQQHGMPRQIQAEFRNYEEYQTWQVK